MVQAGKARKFAGAGESRVSQRRENSTLFSLGRQNDSQIGGEQFGTQEGFTTINQTGIQDTSKAPLSGAQFFGAIGFNRQLINLDEATGVLTIGAESVSGNVFDIPPGDASVVVIGGDGLTSDLSEIQFPQFNGHRLCLYLNALQTITIKNEPGSVLYKIKTGTGADVITSSGEERIIDFVWSITLAMWILIGASLGGGAQCPVICTENDLGSVSGTVDVDWSLANFHRAVITGDTSFNFINTPASTLWQDICLEVQQDSVGGHLVSFQQVMDNGFVPVAITGASRYSSWQIYTYEEPGGTDVFQAFNKSGNTGPEVPGGGGTFQGFSGYIQSILSANQTTNLIVGAHIEFDTIVKNEQLAVSSGGGQSSGIFSGFTVGHLYECEVYLAGEGSANTLNFGAQWFDRQLNVLIGTEGTNLAETGASNKDSQQVAKAFFQATGVFDQLEVQITDNVVLTAILDGTIASDGTCFVTIKDCGVPESVINQPEPAPEDILLDIREMTYLSVAVNSASTRFSTWQGNLNNNSVASDQTISQAGILKELSINVSQKGAGVITFRWRKNGAVFGPIFQLPASTTGFFEFLNLNLPWNRGDTLGWQTTGGVGGQPAGDQWNITLVYGWS